MRSRKSRITLSVPTPLQRRMIVDQRLPMHRSLPFNTTWEVERVVGTDQRDVIELKAGMRSRIQIPFVLPRQTSGLTYDDLRTAYKEATSTLCERDEFERDGRTWCD